MGFPPVRAVRNNTAGSVPGQVPGGRRDAGPYIGERGVSLSVPSVLQERHSACLGDGRQYLSYWRYLPGHPERDRALQPDRKRDASRRLDTSVWRSDWLRGGSPAPGSGLRTVGTAGCEKLTYSLQNRFVREEGFWVEGENGAAQEKEGTREQVHDARADPARGNRHGSRIRRGHGWGAGQARGGLRQPPPVHSREDDASAGEIVPSPHRRRGLLRYRRHRGRNPGN